MLWGINRRKKVRKTFFYIHTNIVTKKWGQQNARNNFSRNTLIVRAKNVGKKIVGKKWENVFFLSQEYRDQKMGGKNARNNFSSNTLIVRAKNVGKKIVEKSAKNVFYMHTNIFTKKWGGKTRETIFQKHKNSAIKKC